MFLLNLLIKNILHNL